jgi:N4-(beta-N-acetylglucosaminyl)-L-asparaginase
MEGRTTVDPADSVSQRFRAARARAISTRCRRIDSGAVPAYFIGILNAEIAMDSLRRDFLKQAALVSAGAVVGGAWPAVPSASSAPAGVRAIASGNGLRAVEKAAELIRGGADALDGVIAGVNIIEDDPGDVTVGRGGLPNEDGIVELDAAVMHGPTHRAGAVACLRNIRNPSSVARVVMERTDHVLLVGEGALRFARSFGFAEEDLLTAKSRELFLRWRESRSTEDDWLPAHGDTTRAIGMLPEHLRPSMEHAIRHTGTIHCSAIDLRGNISCVTSTSGLAYKVPGRVGDSPIIGAGLYVDNEVGAAGSTGRGEANLVNCSCVMIVEFMRQGKTPEQACLQACERVVRHTKMRRLLDDSGRPTFSVSFYALNRGGESGAAAIYSGPKYAVHDGTASSLVPMAYLYKREGTK